MQQFKHLLNTILSKGTRKPPARENMPATISYFGYQFRHNLREGFPLLTLKKIKFKHIVTELLWFLKGDTNIKFLVDNGFNMWNQDAYNYYVKIASKNTDATWNAIYMPVSNSQNIRSLNLRCHSSHVTEGYSMFTYEEFVELLTLHPMDFIQRHFTANGYTLGDCGNQYGKLWRNWVKEEGNLLDFSKPYSKSYIDQLADLIKGLKETPDSRRHIITAWNPATLDDMALNACHCLVQFNCRPLTEKERRNIWTKNMKFRSNEQFTEDLQNGVTDMEFFDRLKIPKYYLDCQMYQRSADVFLGVPFNIASYALLTEILAKLCNMVAGEYVHTFGDVHIYENHMDQVNEIRARQPKELPTLNINTEFWQTESGECGIGNLSTDGFLNGLQSEDFIKCLMEAPLTPSVRKSGAGRPKTEEGAKREELVISLLKEKKKGSEIVDILKTAGYTIYQTQISQIKKNAGL